MDIFSLLLFIIVHFSDLVSICFDMTFSTFYVEKVGKHILKSGQGMRLNELGLHTYCTNKNDLLWQILNAVNKEKLSNEYFQRYFGTKQ